MHFFFVPNRRFYLLVGLMVSLVLMFSLTAAVHAQEVTDPAPISISTPTPDETPITPVIPPDVLPVADAGAALFALLLNLIVPFASSPLTTTLVAVVKLFVPANISAGIIKNVIAAILTGLYWLAVHYNFQDTFASLGQFLVTVVPAAFLVYKNFVDSSRIHEDAVRSDFRLLGYKRTPELKQT